MQNGPRRWAVREGKKIKELRERKGSQRVTTTWSTTPPPTTIGMWFMIHDHVAMIDRCMVEPIIAAYGNAGNGFIDFRFESFLYGNGFIGFRFESL